MAAIQYILNTNERIITIASLQLLKNELIKKLEQKGAWNKSIVAGWRDDITQIDSLLFKLKH